MGSTKRVPARRKSGQGKSLRGTGSVPAPVVIAQCGPKAVRRYYEFFAVNIRNRNTREAYHRAIQDFFSWAADRNLRINDIEPVVVAAYIEYLVTIYSKPTVKQHLAAIRMCFDWLILGQVVSHNPAASVRGPKHVVKRGKTVVLTAEEARRLLDSIATDTLLGLRDRALIATLFFTFARVTAATRMRVDDYHSSGKRSWLRFHEKGGKFLELPAHHLAEEYLDTYLKAAGHGGDKTAPLFRSAQGRSGRLTELAMSRHDVLRMIKRRAKVAGLTRKICCHSCRATGITAFMSNGGLLESAQAIAGHESPKTTKLYDRSQDDITVDEIERIRI